MAKAISLWQVWASLVILGLKEYETRSWATPYRGTLVIHAAKKPFNSADYQPSLARHLLDCEDERLQLSELTYGCALGMVELTAIYRTELLRPKISAREIAFGDYSDGRFAWRLENPKPFAEPIPYKGQQGMWEWYLPLPSMEAT